MPGQPLPPDYKTGFAVLHADGSFTLADGHRLQHGNFTRRFKNGGRLQVTGAAGELRMTATLPGGRHVAYGFLGSCWLELAQEEAAANPGDEGAHARGTDAPRTNKARGTEPVSQQRPATETITDEADDGSPARSMGGAQRKLLAVVGIVALLLVGWGLGQWSLAPDGESAPALEPEPGGTGAAKTGRGVAAAAPLPAAPRQGSVEWFLADSGYFDGADGSQQLQRVRRFDAKKTGDRPAGVTPLEEFVGEEFFQENSESKRLRGRIRALFRLGIPLGRQMIRLGEATSDGSAASEQRWNELRGAIDELPQLLEEDKILELYSLTHEFLDGYVMNFDSDEDREAMIALFDRMTYYVALSQSGIHDTVTLRGIGPRHFLGAAGDASKSVRSVLFRQLNGQHENDGYRIMGVKVDVTGSDLFSMLATLRSCQAAYFGEDRWSGLSAWLDHFDAEQVGIAMQRDANYLQSLLEDLIGVYPWPLAIEEVADDVRFEQLVVPKFKIHEILGDPPGFAKAWIFDRHSLLGGNPQDLERYLWEPWQSPEEEPDPELRVVVLNAKEYRAIFERLSKRAMPVDDENRGSLLLLLNHLEYYLAHGEHYYRLVEQAMTLAGEDLKASGLLTKRTFGGSRLVKFPAWPGEPDVAGLTEAAGLFDATSDDRSALVAELRDKVSEQALSLGDLFRVLVALRVMQVKLSHAATGEQTLEKIGQVREAQRLVQAAGVVPGGSVCSEEIRQIFPGRLRREVNLVEQVLMETNEEFEQLRFPWEVEAFERPFTNLKAARADANAGYPRREAFDLNNTVRYLGRGE